MSLTPIATFLTTFHWSEELIDILLDNVLEVIIKIVQISSLVRYRYFLPNMNEYKDIIQVTMLLQAKFQENR